MPLAVRSDRPHPAEPADARRLDPALGSPARLGMVEAWSRFWFTPQDPIGLHGLRLLAGLFFFAWLFSFLGHEAACFGPQGWLDDVGFKRLQALSEEERGPIASWSPLFLVRTSMQFEILYVLSLVVVGLFTLGVWTRLSAIGTWLVVIGFTSNPLYVYFGGDSLLIVLATYLMVGYVLFGPARVSPRSVLLGDPGHWLSPLRGGVSSPAPGSITANVMLRLLQIHTAIIIATNGLHKLQIDVWWSGLALWFPLHRPFETTLQEVLDGQQWGNATLIMLALGAYLVLAWEVAFPFLVWQARWRGVMIAGAVVAWLGNRFLYQIPLFGPAVFLGCLAFVSPREWRRVVAWASSLARRWAMDRAKPQPVTVENT